MILDSAYLLREIGRNEGLGNNNQTKGGMAMGFTEEEYAKIEAEEAEYHKKEFTAMTASTRDQKEQGWVDRSCDSVIEVALAIKKLARKHSLNDKYVATKGLEEADDLLWELHDDLAEILEWMEENN